MTYEEIEYENNKSKEREKNRITEKLKNLTEEERQVNNEFKQYKLGEWSTGLQKGLVEYDPEFYEKELADQMDSQIEAEEMSLTMLPDDDDYGDLDGDEAY